MNAAGSMNEEGGGERRAQGTKEAREGRELIYMHELDHHHDKLYKKCNQTNDSWGGIAMLPDSM